METIKKEDYTFAADIEKTREYYKTNSLCGCSCCRNYYAQIKNKFPKLSDFLSDFGIDISKPDEIISIETDSEINYMNIDYTVCGSIEKAGQNNLKYLPICGKIPLILFKQMQRTPAPAERKCI